MSNLKFAKARFYALLPCLMLAAAAWANAATPKVLTVAGGYAGNGKPATAAGLDQLSSVAIDAKGNLYVTDGGNCQIRQINSKGIIVKFAGTTVCGFSGDGGPAASAMINSPTTIVFDSAGNLLFGDEGNSRIRKITPAGIISTIAGNGTVGYSGDGGPATEASLNGPTSLFVDSANNIYFTDAFNYVVRKVDAAGVIHTVAGNNQPGFSGDGGPATSAQINYSSGIVADAQGNFYIADSSNNRVRKVDTSGIITTYAGNGQTGNGGSGGPAPAASIGGTRGLLISGGKLYITTFSNVWAVNLATQKIKIIAGDAGGLSGFNGDGKRALATRLQSPWGMAFDSAGGLLIADEGNARVRRISVGNVVTTIAGGHTGDGGPATKSNLNAGFFGGHIAFDPSGNLYLADSSNSRVRKISTAGMITTIAGNGNTGYSGDGGLATEAMLNQPSGVAVDGAGNVYIADSNLIRKVDSNGIITTFATTPANGMAVDVAGNLYVAGFFNGTVLKFTPQGVSSIVAGVQFNFGYNGDGIPATEAWLAFPMGVAVDNAGNLYIADWLNNRIRKVDTSGIISTVAGNGSTGFSGDGGPATSATISNALDVAVDAKGNFYIADASNLRIRVVDASGIIHTLAGSGDAAFYNGNGLPATATNMFPVTVGVSPTGVVYLMDIGSYRLRKVQ